MPTITDKIVEAQERERQAREYMLTGLHLTYLDRQVYNKNMSLYNSMYPEGVMRDVSPFQSADFGSSRFDNRATILQEYSDPTNLRANEQTTFGKWANAFVKTGVPTATTFANVMNTAIGGLVYGILPNVDVVNNPVTRSLLAIEDQFEQWFPNYRTIQEQEAPWWKRMGTANFWADDIMKNIGFSMGSVAAAKLATKGLSSVVRGITKRAYREGFEALGKQFSKNMAGSEIRNVLKQISKDGAEELSKRNVLAKLGRLSKFEDAIQGVTGSVLGALGEAQYEGQRAYNDFIETNKIKLDNWFNENDTYIRMMYKMADGKDEEGNPIDYETFKKAKYDKAVNDIETEALKVGNNIFGYETALLSATNFATFRKFFGGGFKNFNPVISKTTAPLVVGNEISKNIGVKTLSDGTKQAFSKMAGLRKVKPLLKGAITEGPVEEMGQNFINKTSEFYHGSYLNEHIGMLLNDDYNSQTASGINSIINGFAQSYGDPEQWQDGFAGAIFGIAGVPGIHRNPNYKTKPETEDDTRARNEKHRFVIDGIPFFTAEGSIRKEWKEIQDREKLVNETVDYVNNFIKSPEQQKKFEDNVLFVAFGDKMKNALDVNDLLEYKDSEYDELMTVVNAFSNANMDDVLDNMIDSVAANLNDEKIEQIRPMLSEMEQDKSAKEIRERLEKDVKKTKELIADYRAVRNDLTSVYGRSFTPKNLDVLAEMLSLADYKNSRAVSIMEKYPEIFDKEGNIADKMDQIVKVLNFDDMRIDNYENLSKEDQQNLQSELTMKSITTMPSEWNMAKRAKAYIDIADAYRNFKQAIQLNNEFATMVVNPNLMNAVFEKLYNDHLDEKEKQEVENMTAKFEAAQTEEEVKQLVDSLKDDNIGRTLRLRFGKFENPVVKSYLENRRKESVHNALLEYMSSQSDAIAESFGVDKNYVQSVADILKNTNYDNAADILAAMRDAEPDEKKKQFLEHLQSYFSNIKTSSQATQPQNGPQEGSPDMEDRKNKIDNLIVNEKAFKDLVSDAGNKDGSNPIIYSAGTMRSAGFKKTLKDGSTLYTFVTNDLYKNKTYLTVCVGKNQKFGKQYFAEMNDGVYQDDRRISVLPYKENIVKALKDAMPNAGTDEISSIIEEMSHMLMYHPLNATIAKRLKQDGYDELLDYLGIKVEEAVPEITSQQQEDNAEQRYQKLQQKGATFDKLHKEAFEQTKAVYDKWSKIVLIEDRANNPNYEAITNTAKDALENLGRLRIKANEILSKDKDKITNGDISEMNILITDISQYNIKAPDPFKETVTKQPEPEQSQRLFKEYDSKNQFLAPVTEFDLPDSSNSVAGVFDEGVPSRQRILTSENGRRVTVNGETINIDGIIQEILYDAPESDTQTGLFMLAIGDKVHFGELNEKQKNQLQPFYGDKMPFAVLDNTERIVGLVVPDGNISLWNAINKNPNLTIKIRDKFAYRSRLVHRENDDQQPEYVNYIQGGRFGIMGFVDRKHNVHLSLGDIQYYKDEFGFTDDDLHTLVAEIQKREYNPGTTFILLDKGDHLRQHTWNEADYVNFHADNLHLPKTFELQYNTDLRNVVSQVTDTLSNVSPESVKTANQLLDTYFATGHTSKSKLEIINDKETGGYILHAIIRDQLDTIIEDLSLFRIGTDFKEKFENLIFDKNTQESYNIPGNIVVSVNDKTMSADGIINSNNIRNFVQTWQKTYIPYNVNAIYDFDPEQSKSQQNSAEVPEGAQEVEDNSKPSFTGINKESLDKFKESVNTARATLMQNQDVKDFVDAICNTAAGKSIPANESEYANRLNMQLTSADKAQFINTLSKVQAACNQLGIEVSGKNIFVTLFANTNDDALMGIYKDC